jgi:hypothetical protein
MKKISVSIPCTFVMLALVLCVSGSAQQSDLKEKTQASASLEMSLDQLKRGLKESVALDFRHGYARRTYVRLKRTDGCNISFQVSQVPGSSKVHEPQQPGSDLSTAEWKVNLSNLDIAEVKIETAVKGDYRVIHFATIGRKESIKWKGFGVGEGGWVSEGRIDIGEKVTPRIAAALQQAIIACRE